MRMESDEKVVRRLGSLYRLRVGLYRYRRHWV